MVGLMARRLPKAVPDTQRGRLVINWRFPKEVQPLTGQWFRDRFPKNLTPTQALDAQIQAIEKSQQDAFLSAGRRGWHRRRATTRRAGDTGRWRSGYQRIDRGAGGGKELTGATGDRQQGAEIGAAVRLKGRHQSAR
jgi:hypothetical protein